MASMHAASAPVRTVRTPAGDPAWLVSGYDEVRALIADSRLSWTTSAAGASQCSQAAMMGHPDAPGQNSGAGMSFAKVLARSFAPRRIKQLRPRVQQLCDDLLDELAAQTPPVDFHKAVSFPLPAMVICEVLGVPPQDRTEFRIWSDEAACKTDRDRAQAGRDQLHTYMIAALIEDKRAHPGQDVLTDLVAAADAQGHDPQKVVVRLAAGLLFAGARNHGRSQDGPDRGLAADPEHRRPGCRLHPGDGRPAQCGHPARGADRAGAGEPGRRGGAAGVPAQPGRVRAADLDRAGAVQGR
jgi:cytochrome P450